MSHAMRYGIALVAVVVLLAACTRETPDVSQNSPSQSTTMPPEQGAATQTTVPASANNPETDEPQSRPTAASPTQEVHLIEYQIHLPQSVPAGRVAFNVENGGKEDHAFEIEGHGVHEKTQVLKRGNTAALEVNLAPGTYTVYCPVNGHKDKGMKTTLVVK
jgi:uncharacterized cupredoxin-like copper-binding protein